MDERQIEQLAPELGRRAASRMDPEATADAVRRRLSRPVRIVWWRRRVLQAAALVVLVLGGAFVARAFSGSAEPMTLAAPVELQELATAELGDVLHSLETDLPASELVPASLDDLDETQLRDLLELMEG